MEVIMELLNKLYQQEHEIKELKARMSELESAMEQLNAALNCCGYHDQGCY